ncbi:MAG: response regulator [Mariprofundaceae bacterium]|nr:response regulator [Mariprofundaceae bacterium]
MNIKTSAYLGMVGLVVLLLLLGWWLTYQLTEVASELRKDQEIARAAMVAAAIDPMQLKTLQGSKEDIGKVAFASVRSDLKRMHTLIPEAQFIYIMAMQGNHVIFLADAEATDSEDYSPPGQVYDEASLHLREIFSTGIAFMDPEPYTDRWGTWISAHAPIFDPVTGEILAISGIDIPEQQWLGIQQDYRYKAIALAALIFTLLFLTFALFISKKREQANKEKYLELFENQSQAVLIFDQESLLFEELNKQALLMFGYSKEALLECTTFDISDEKDVAKHGQHALYAAAAERVFKRQDGSCFSGEVFTLGHFTLGNQVKVIAVVGDITARKLQENEVLKLDLEAKHAAAASRAKSLFLATMSHELRTPLHGIIGLQSMLSEEADYLKSEHRKHLELSLHSSHVLQALIDDILDLSKIEADKVELHLTTFNLPDTLHDAMIPFVVAAAEKGVQLRLVFNHLVKNIEADQGKIRQILLNVVGNALKFTEKGYVCVMVQMQDGHVVMAVEDSGIGIADDALQALFEPFAQLSTTQQQKGTGLGTTIAKQLAQRMGGDIQVKSELGVGSVFSINIPVKAMGEQEVSGEVTLSCSLDSMPHKVSDTGKSDMVVGLKNLSGMRVLLAEDDDISRMIAVKRLRRAGMLVETAENGLIAWEKLQAESFDLLLTDIRMPEMDGITLTRKIRAAESGGQSSLRIVGISADVLDDVGHQCLAAGMDDFIRKPIDPDELLQRLVYQH